jgi:hypothetical protein
VYKILGPRIKLVAREHIRIPHVEPEPLEGHPLLAVRRDSGKRPISRIPWGLAVVKSRSCAHSEFGSFWLSISHLRQFA